MGRLMLRMRITEKAVLVRTACAQYRAFPQELLPEGKSRVRRVTPLKVYSVSALKSCAITANCGWYRGRVAFRPEDGMEGVFL